MRARFSLRFVLLAFALLAAALYVFVVRPTMLAQAFADAVSRKDFDAARGMMADAGDWDRIVNGNRSFKTDRVYVDLLPREWEDAWRGRRRIIVHVMRHDSRYGDPNDWLEDTDLVAGPRGVRVVSPFEFQFNFPEVQPQLPGNGSPGDGVRVEPELRRG